MYVAVGKAPLAGALGASQISWWCWDAPGFKACHGQKYAEAQAFCAATANSGYTDTKTCIEKETDIRAIKGCLCPDQAPDKPGEAAKGSIWGQLSALPTNTKLLAVGAIAVAGLAAWYTRKGSRAQ